MPLYNWQECEKGNIKFVNKDHVSRQNDIEIWSILYNQYLERFGLGDDLSEIIRLKKKLIALRCSYIINGNKKILNQIAIDEANLLKLEGLSVNGLTMDETLVYLSKWLGYRLDKKVITIVEYKTLVDEYGRAHKKE